MGQRIAILGNGPTSLYAALLLSVKGHAVTLYDPKTAWETHCGGAIAGPVLKEMPLFEDFSDFVAIEGLKLLSPKNRYILIPFETPLPIALRDALTGFLSRKAEAERIALEPRRLEGFSADGNGWRIRLKGGEERADFLIVADGAGSLARKELGANGLDPEMTLEVGYDLTARFETGPTGLIKFLPEMRGCFWAMPNGKGSTVRLWSTGRGLQTRDLLEKLDGIVQRLLDTPLHGDLERSVAQVHVLKKASKKHLFGERWVVLGDAAGFVHPLSKDGLYFGLKSATAFALSFGETGLDARAYWRRLKDQVLKPLGKRSARQRWWRHRFVVDWILRRTKVSEKSRRFLSELVGAKPI